MMGKHKSMPLGHIEIFMTLQRTWIGERIHTNISYIASLEIGIPGLKDITAVNASDTS